MITFTANNLIIRSHSNLNILATFSLSPTMTICADISTSYIGLFYMFFFKQVITCIMCTVLPPICHNERRGSRHHTDSFSRIQTVLLSDFDCFAPQQVATEDLLTRGTWICPRKKEVNSEFNSGHDAHQLLICRVFRSEENRKYVRKPEGDWRPGKNGSRTEKIRESWKSGREDNSWMKRENNSKGPLIGQRKQRRPTFPLMSKFGPCGCRKPPAPPLLTPKHITLTRNKQTHAHMRGWVPLEKNWFWGCECVRDWVFLCEWRWKHIEQQKHSAA